MTLQKFSKLVYWTMWLALATSLILWIVFSYLNWEFISNPNLIPNYYEGNALFAYNESLAVFRNTGFYLPGSLISYTLYLHSLLLFHLLIYDSLIISLKKLIIFFGTILIAISSDFVFEFFGLINTQEHWQYSIVGHFDWFLIYTVLFSMFFSFVGSIVHLIITKFKSNLGFLFLGIFSAMMFFAYCYLYMFLFFD